MLTATALAHLRRHQDAMAALLDETAALLAREAEAARLPLARARWSLARCGRAYQLFKHGEIFDPAIAGGPPRQAAMAAEMRRACLRLSADYETYARRWGGRDVGDEWDAYRFEAWAMVRRLRRHLIAERQQVERLLAGATSTRRLA